MAPVGGKTLLIVEDNEASRAALAGVLRAEGYAVAAVADGQAALDHLRAGPMPDLIVLDMFMPILDGWHFLSELKRDPRLAGVPVLIATASGVISREWALAHGCAGCLQKPIDAAALLEEVRRCCP